MPSLFDELSKLQTENAGIRGLLDVIHRRFDEQKERIAKLEAVAEAARRTDTAIQRLLETKPCAHEMTGELIDTCPVCYVAATEMDLAMNLDALEE